MPEPNNQPRKQHKEEKHKQRREGKSQCRRGATTKSKLQVPTVVALPSKTPSPATTATPVTASPAVMAPPAAAIVAIPVTTNLIKDPTAVSPNLLTREGKAVRRRGMKDKVEKDPPKTTIRKKKNSATHSISVEVKTSSENDARVGSKGEKKKKSNTSSESGGRKKKMENKSDGSKEPSDNDEKTPKFNREVAQSFFKQYQESQRARKRLDDARLETMPESSQLNMSIRAMRKTNKGKKQQEILLDKDLFRENGEPVWMIPEDMNKEPERNEDGTTIKNPILVAALAEAELELDEKTWFDYVDQYYACSMSKGDQLPENYELDPFAPFDALKNTNKYVQETCINYNTVKNLVDLSDAAITRFKEKRDGLVNDRPRHNQTQDTTVTTETTSTISTIPPNPQVSTELFQLKTCVATRVSFNMKNVVSVRYDRQNAVSSIKKLRKKLNNTYSQEQAAHESKNAPSLRDSFPVFNGMSHSFS